MPSSPSDCVVCVIQGDRGRDGAPGFPGLQGRPVSITLNIHLTSTDYSYGRVVTKQYENHQNQIKDAVFYTDSIIGMILKDF